WNLRRRDTEAVERRPPHAGGKRADRAELPRCFVVGQDRAAVHPNEARRDAGDQRDQLIDVGDASAHFGDAEERGQDLGLANFLSFGHSSTMRPDAIRTFPAGYHGSGGARNDFTGWTMVSLVASARTLLGSLGVGIAVVGIAVAWSGIDRFVGFASLIVGGFLLMFPFMRPHEDE